MNTLHKDITEHTEGLVVHGVNCQGVMGSGVALAIRNKWPKVYEEYVENGTGAQLLGTFQPVVIDENLVVGNCYTQENFGSDGKVYADLLAIKKSLSEAAEYAKENKLKLITPLIGCGLGGLRVSEVGPVLHEIEEKYKIDIEINYL